jgi:N6-L-threonylcarbamoyladenine synthase
MRILAFESSCDENSVAVVCDGRLLALETRTQSVHAAYGGVVPELAGRSHIELVDDIAARVLMRASISISDVDLIAATVGPGLVGSLLVGASYARGVALASGKPFCGIHHLEAHLWSVELSGESLPFPFLVLLVSGGHTLLVEVKGLRDYRVLGGTLDDALGEAYDKVGKLVGLAFPAGAEVDRLSAGGNLKAYSFPAPMSDSGLNFSFSGLKTAFLYAVKDHRGALEPQTMRNLLASFQEAALESVVRKVRLAVMTTGVKAIAVAGGVAANSQLRAKLSRLGETLGVPCRFPALDFCGDNAAMIGYLAWRLSADRVPFEPISVRPRWSLNTLLKGDKTA